MKRKPSLASLRRKLDRVFAAYIRQRDSGKPCITCGKVTELECGHFVPRQHAAARWDEHNAHGQCSYDNRWRHGAVLDYYEALIKKYGLEEARRVRALRYSTWKPTRSDLEQMIKRFSQ